MFMFARLYGCAQLKFVLKFSFSLLLVCLVGSWLSVSTGAVVHLASCRD